MERENMFDVQKGRLHLVFMDKEDVYYLPSAAKVNYVTYLYWCLKNAKYRNVYIVGSNGIYDHPNFHKDHLCLPGYSHCDVVRNTFSANEKTALVMSAATFGKWFEEGSDAARLYIGDDDGVFRLFKSKNQNRQPLDNKKSIIVVIASNVAQDNVELLNPNGPLARLDESAKLALSDRDVNKSVYAQLKDQMGSRCIFFNDVSRERIKNMLNRQCLVGSMDALLSEDLDDWAEYLFADYVGRGEGIIDIGEKGRLAAVRDELRNPVKSKAVKQLVDDKYVNTINLKYTDRSCNMFAENELMNYWKTCRNMLSSFSPIKQPEHDFIMHSAEWIDKAIRNICLQPSFNESQGRYQLVKKYIKSVNSSNRAYQEHFRYHKINALKSLLERYYAPCIDNTTQLLDKIIELSDSAQGYWNSYSQLEIFHKNAVSERKELFSQHPDIHTMDNSSKIKLLGLNSQIKQLEISVPTILDNYLAVENCIKSAESNIHLTGVDTDCSNVPSLITEINSMLGSKIQQQIIVGEEIVGSIDTTDCSEEALSNFAASYEEPDPDTEDEQRLREYVKSILG